MGFLASLYFLQIASPLRLDHDAVMYLRIAIGMADGSPIEKPDFPLGYPALIALFDAAGLGASGWFILLNCVSIGVGLFAVWRMPGRWKVVERKWAIALTLLSFVMVRTIAMPLSDPVFFGVSLLAISAMCVADDEDGRYRVWHLVAAAGLTAVAVWVRLVGVALLPALCFTIVRFVVRRTRRSSSGVPVAGLLLCAAGIALLAALPGQDSFDRYRDLGTSRWSGGSLFTLVTDRSWLMLANLGELTINLPHSRFEWLDPYLPFAGLIVAHPLLAGLWKLRRVSPLGIYMAVYVGILVLWPFNAVRLWAPILPIVLMFAASIAQLDPGAVAQPDPLVLRASGLVVRIWLAWFALTGLGALAWTTRLTLSGDRFISVYGHKGSMATPGFESINPDYDANARLILFRYDPRQARLRYAPRSPR